jgi:hypothetical protein
MFLDGVSPFDNQPPMSCRWGPRGGHLCALKRTGNGAERIPSCQPLPHQQLPCFLHHKASIQAPCNPVTDPGQRDKSTTAEDAAEPNSIHIPKDFENIIRPPHTVSHAGSRGAASSSATLIHNGAANCIQPVPLEPPAASSLNQSPPTSMTTCVDEPPVNFLRCPAKLAATKVRSGPLRSHYAIYSCICTAQNTKACPAGLSCRRFEGIG